MSQPYIEERIRIDTQLDPRRSELDLAQLRRGLLATPKRLPSKYFYDKRGSALFEQITNQPEYYPTRTEGALLVEVADEISRVTGAEELVELGAGAAIKTRILLDAMQRSGALRLFVPFDVSGTEVRRVSEELAEEYPELQVHGIVADFVQHLTAIPAGAPRLVVLLGGTIGNYPPVQAISLLQHLNDRMASGDFFLLGADLIKEIDRIERAYNDDAGVTAAFNRNILNAVNRIAGGNFNPALFDHKATYNREHDRIEMHLVARLAHQVELTGLGLELEIGENEAILTEISCKYDRSRIQSMLDASGFQLERWFTDRDQLFALALAQKR